MQRMIAITLALAGVRVFAEQLPIEHVLVSVPLHKQTAETALPVTVLSGDALSRAAAATIGDTLNNAPGLANASFGPAVGQPVIRGQQGPRVTVLQNGTSSADASSLSADHAVSVEALLADSIEVLRGPSTLLYGGGAIGGVVNVIDNRIPTKALAGLEGGLEYRHNAASDMDTLVGRLEAGSGNFAVHLDGLSRDWNNLRIPGYATKERDEHEVAHNHGPEEQAAKGYIDNSDGRTRSVSAGGSYHFDRGFVGLSVSRLENNYGIPAGAHEHALEEEHAAEHSLHSEHSAGGVRIDLEQTRYDAALHLHDPLPGLEVARTFLSYTDYQHRELEPSGELGTRYNSDSWEGRVELLHKPIASLHGVLGLQVSAREFSALGEEAFVPVTDSRGFGVFLLEDYHSGDWTFEGGLRLDRDERKPDSVTAPDRSFSSFSVSASGIWEFGDAWHLGLALSRAERAPAIEELYSNVEAVGLADYVAHAATNAIELGNPDLDTEVSYNADLSLRWDVAAHFVKATLFYNDFSDYISLENTGLEYHSMPVLSYQQADARFQGLELESEFSLAVVAGGTVLLSLFGDVIRGDLESGADVPRLPPRRLGGRLSWQGEALELWARGVDVAEQKRAGFNEADTAAYRRWDLGADYRLAVAAGELTLFVTLQNLQDEEIRLSTSFLRDVAPEAGRSIEAGLRYRF